MGKGLLATLIGALVFCGSAGAASGGEQTVQVIHCGSSEANQDGISIGPYTVELETEDGVINVNCFARDLELVQEAVLADRRPHVWGRKGWTSLPYHLFFNGFVDPRQPLSDQQLNYSQCDPGTQAVILRFDVDESSGEIACSTTRADLSYLRSLEEASYSHIVRSYLEKLEQF